MTYGGRTPWMHDNAFHDTLHDRSDTVQGQGSWEERHVLMQWNGLPGLTFEPDHLCHVASSVQNTVGIYSLGHRSTTNSAWIAFSIMHEEGGSGQVPT